MTKWDLYKEYNDFCIRKSINIIHHSNCSKKKNNIFLPIDAKRNLENLT